MRALVVDDSRLIREYLHALFAHRGIPCVEAADGSEGLHCLRELGPFQFALLDWDMPVMSGIEMLKAARADSRFDGTRFIMMTSEADNDHIECAIESGADEYLVKPFDEWGLFEKLRRAGVEEL